MVKTKILELFNSEQFDELESYVSKLEVEELAKALQKISKKIIFIKTLTRNSFIYIIILLFISVGKATTGIWVAAV